MATLADPGDTEQLELQQNEEQELRSRVQAVSLRRRPSDDTDSHRSSLVSHHSFASVQSAPSTDWLLRSRKTTSTGLSVRLAKQPSFREQFDEDRCSLPTMESYHAEETSKAGVTPVGGETKEKRTFWKKEKKDKHKIQTKSRDSKEAFDVYFAPQSPVPSTVHSAPRTRTKSGISHVSERKGAVLTEVGEPNFALPVFQKEHQRSHRKGFGEDYEDDDLENGECEKTPLDAMQFFMNGAPHVSIEEAQKYTFAIVLKHTEQIFHLLKKRFPSRSAASIRRDLPQQVSTLQQKCVRRLIQAGLGVILLDNALYDSYLDDQRGIHNKRDPNSKEEDVGRNLCILIDPKKNPDLLLHEFKRELDELSIKRGDSLGRLAEESLDSLKEMCFSPALELQLTHNIIQNAFKDYDKEEWVIDVNKELTVNDVIVECFPLHDRAFNKQFFDEYRKRTFELNLRKAAAGNSDRWAVEELRLHFGERVAFLFAFMHIYTKHLLPLTLSCLFYYLCFRFTTTPLWKQYMEGLAILGVFVVCFWGPSFLVCWARETRLLVEKWNLTKYKNTVYERNDDNPGFKYMWVKNRLTHEMEKIPKQRKNHWIQLTMFFFVLVCALIQCVCLVPFIQWYVYAKNAPTCDACNGDTEESYACIWFITCFNSTNSALGTDRWVYILIQGIILGLLIDIIFFELFNWMSEKFVQWENYAKKSDHENRLIHRRFVFVWSNWFFWFLFISFVYLPFGNTILKFFHKIGLGALAPYEWNPNLLTLDTLFVTPLVVTQFLNMLLETIAPYLLRKLRGRPSIGCRQASPFTWCVQHLSRCFRFANNQRQSMQQVNFSSQETASAISGQSHQEVKDNGPVTNLTATRLAHLVQRETGFYVKVLPMSDDSNKYSAYEILAEAKLPIFDPVLDYLDACIQFSYVMMFTVVWPLLPFPAFFNNILEVRGDAFRLLFANRRPMPRRDTSIGEWATVLAYANIIGVTVVSAFVVVYHYGYFRTDCNFTFSNAYVVPFGTIDPSETADPSTCVNESDSSRWRMFQIVLFVVLEHVSFCVRYLVMQAEKTPSSIRSSGYLRLKQIQHLTATPAAPPSQLEYVQRLRVLFEKYDVDGDGHLAERELIQLLAAWLCKHPSELLPYSGLIFRYMDKNKLGRVPFSTCCLMMQHVNHDRFFSCLLGLYDPLNGAYNDEIRRTCDPIELHRVLSEVSSDVHRRSNMSRASEVTDASRPRDSTFFYVDN
ncbi:Anoctamin-10 [Phytophthora citrophthora]|uniref:Anoctamin-10 n=1 Tax=Phytophthora citrophthora TaxID=4793 RepID=A0AAD9LPE4_9STRA|nr:Anoctamin-10 [Phytophthora citrophthora]